MHFLRRFIERILGVVKPAPSVVLPTQTSLLTLPDFVPAGFKHGVEILNDNGTPMQFVVSALGTHLGLNYKDSVRTMLTIHSRGGALLAVPSMAEALRAAEAVTAEAAGHNYPLVCRAVSATK